MREKKTGRKEYRKEGEPRFTIHVTGGRGERKPPPTPVCERHLRNATEVISSTKRKDQGT